MGQASKNISECHPSFPLFFEQTLLFAKENTLENPVAQLDSWNIRENLVPQLAIDDTVTW
jgi:hypothetical protein